jgi:presenilin-like A22 family membrane protease
LKKPQKLLGEKPLGDKFKARPIHLAPVLVSLSFSVLCAFLILTSSMETYPITPFPESISGSFGNAFYFVILVGVGASLLYLLIKRRNRKLITLITGFALITAIFMLCVVYLLAIFSGITFPYMEIWILTASLIITVLSSLMIFRFNSRICDVIILFLGGALGAFLGASIPTLSTILILIFLAVYDAFTVYYGPVGKMAHIGLEQFRGLSYSFKGIQMGLGDLTFYSMLSGHMFINFGFTPSLASIFGIVLGCLLVFKILEIKGMFPGLPFPVLFGLAFGFLASLANL